MVLDLSADRVTKRLRLAKNIALDQKSKTALKAVNKALAKVEGEGIFTEQEARELDLLVELDCVKTALYRHYDTDGQLLYVGISISALRRLGQHKLESHWFERIARIDISWHDSRSQALAAERAAIKSDQPLYNVTHNANAPKP